METIFLSCAVIGGTLLLCQFVLGLFGLGEHHDVGGHVGSEVAHDVGHDAGHDSQHDDHGEQGSWLASVITFRSLVAALTFFGLAGMAATTRGLEPVVSVAVGLAAGGAGLMLVGTLMRNLARLRADGTAHVERTVGKVGTVYLSIPAARGGAGKISIVVQNRLMEYQALTPGEALPTGAPVRVTAVLSADTVEVLPAPFPEPERTAHV